MNTAFKFVRSVAGAPNRPDRVRNPVAWLQGALVVLRQLFPPGSGVFPSAAAWLLTALLSGCGGGGDSAASATATDAAGRVSALASTGTAETVANASSTTWTACAGEGQNCAFTGQKLVRYGSGSTYAMLTLTGGTPCTNAVFGDPAYGVVKACDYADPPAAAAAFDPTAWTLCAAENGTCSFSGTRTVRYGTTTQAVVLQIAASTACSNAVFGDPAYGVVKSCWVAAAAAPAASETWTACAQENQFCAFTGTRAVRYGSGTSVVTATFSGGVNCTNAVFGDPAYGVVKTCSVSSIDTSAPAGPVVSGVTVPALTVSVLGTPLQLSATVSVQGGGTASAAATVWTVADPTVATLTPAGAATPLRPGFTTVTATAGGKSASGTLTVRGPTPIPTRSQSVGTNVGGVAYYGSNFPFADLMKSGGGWGSSDGTPFPSVSADGYPTALNPGQKASTPVAWGGTHYPAGRYTVLWDGDGTISFPLSNVTIAENASHRIVLDVTDTSGQLWVGIDSTSPANPVRNVRFLLPGTESTYAAQPFNPVYLQKIAPFSTLRFMDWGGTNGSPIVEWADRSLPTNATYTTSKGVPIEVMIDLANSLHVDPWFCIPHMASDDYVSRFAALLHARLDPTLRPHIEYSNEVWNTGFAQNAWASKQSDAQGLARPWGMPSIFYAKRAVQMFKIMQSVYGSTDAHRLVRVIAGQAAWTQFLQDALGSADTASNADVLAVAPYFNAGSVDDPANVNASLALTSSQVVDQMLASVRGPIKSWMTSNGALAAQYHLKMKAYESGPGDTTSYFPADKQQPMTALFSAANADPRMKDLYVEYFSQWKAAGGDTMNQYVDVSGWGIYGFWGALQWTWQDVSTSPKYQGLLAFIATNPLTTGETALRADRSR